MSTLTAPTLALPAQSDARLHRCALPGDDSPAPHADLDQALAVQDAWLRELEDLHEQAVMLAEKRKDVEAAVVLFWEAACERLGFYHELMTDARQLVRSSFRRRFLREVGSRADRLARTMRTMVTGWAGSALQCPPEIQNAIWTIRIPPFAYLRAMWNLFWSAIRHPQSDTTIDLSTGRVLYRC